MELRGVGIGYLSCSTYTAPDGSYEMDMKNLSVLTKEITEKVLPQQNQVTNPNQQAAAKQDNAYVNIPGKPILWLFVSASMTELELKKTYEIAAEWNGRIIYRGLNPDQPNLNQAVRDVAALRHKLEKAKAVVRQGQTLQLSENEQDRSGIFIDPMAIANNELVDNRLDLGETGLVFGIDEVDFVEEAKARIAAIDWEKKKDEAVARHWRIREYTDLGTSELDSESMFNPSIVVSKDIVAKDGTVLAKNGTVFNPLTMMPMHLTVMVFDGTNLEEVEFIKLKMQDVAKGQVQLISTLIDKERGFEHLKELNQFFGQPVTLLTKDIKDRFALTATPTRIQTTDLPLLKLSLWSRATVRQTVQQHEIDKRKE